MEELEFKLTPNAIVISHFLSLEKHDCDDIKRTQKTVLIKIGRVRRSFPLLNQNILSIPLGLRTFYLYQVMIIATDYKLYLLLFFMIFNSTCHLLGRDSRNQTEASTL